jgi:hypothetical protein
LELPRFRRHLDASGRKPESRWTRAREPVGVRRRGAALKAFAIGEHCVELDVLAAQVESHVQQTAAASGRFQRQQSLPPGGRVSWHSVRWRRCGVGRTSASLRRCRRRDARPGRAARARGADDPSALHREPSLLLDIHAGVLAGIDLAAVHRQPCLVEHEQRLAAVAAAADGRAGGVGSGSHPRRGEPWQCRAAQRRRSAVCGLLRRSSPNPPRRPRGRPPRSTRRASSPSPTWPSTRTATCTSWSSRRTGCSRWTRPAPCIRSRRTGRVRSWPRRAS